MGNNQWKLESLDRHLTLKCWKDWIYIMGNKKNYLMYLFICLILLVGNKMIYCSVPDAKYIFSDDTIIKFINCIKYGKYKDADELIKNGMDINFKNIQGITPLYYFFLKKDYRSFKKMLELGADPNISPDGLGLYYLLSATMLIYDDRYFRLLLDYNVDINYNPPIQKDLSRREASVLEFSLGTNVDIKYLKMLLVHGIKPYYSELPINCPILDANSLREYKKVIMLLDYYPDYLSDNRFMHLNKRDATIKDLFLEDLKSYDQAPGSQQLKDQHELVKYLKDKFNIDIEMK
jgi:hypothetical protein